ncbi:hypothetical protein CEXT_195071 [Caerostris extrusa]|uniref:Uncharacterized protein n=1 Tax=Caerostris extrusa TaxID=172846 RepID=A0AAV4M871_CAEEX|nr:hypothetical protein CEXT_195071 [Caerostris extrusa]
MGKDDTDSLAQSCKEEKKKHSKTKSGEEKRKGKKKGGAVLCKSRFFPVFPSSVVFCFFSRGVFWGGGRDRSDEPFSFIEIEALETFQVLYAKEGRGGLFWCGA